MRSVAALEQEVARLHARLADSERRRARAEAHLGLMKTHDPVTGLPNRARLLERLGQAMGRPGPLAVLHVGLDAFRHVNESLGRAAGDRVLVCLGERLRDGIAGEALVARGDGDEFVVAARVARAGAAQLADRLLELLRRPVVARRRELRLSASIGIALYPGDAAEPGSLLAAAGVAMRHAKEHGRRGAHAFSAAPSQDALSRLHLRSELARAVERSEFRFHYQPQVALASGKLSGVEALVRWRHPERGLVMPGEFIDLADEMGLTPWITAETVRCALGQLAAWDATGLAIASVAINLSARQFGDASLAATVAASLERFGIAPRRLVVEITETAMLQFEGSTAANLEALSALGVPLSLDDFGTGYSNLAYLQRLPIAQLKLDRSFVRALGAPSGSDSLVKAVVAMARGLGLEVVAEGIETPQQLATLRAVGCEHGQGHYFAPALPPRALARYAGYGARGTSAMKRDSKRNGIASPGATVTFTQPTNGLPQVSTRVTPGSG